MFAYVATRDISLAAAVSFHAVAGAGFRGNDYDCYYDIQTALVIIRRW